MEIKGAYRIPADRATVWEKLNDPEVLKACIPGCQEFEAEENGYAATVKTKIGPVSATFKGAVTLEDVDPPNGYRIVGEGKGGVAGFAKGGAKVDLTEEPDGKTILTYNAEAKVGGKLAQIGSRLVLGTARKLSDQFFTSFVEAVAPGHEVEKLEIPEDDAAE
jgi:carbon monoxide dehydrogenase subunit G